MSLHTSMRQWILLACVWLLIGGVVVDNMSSSRKFIDAQERIRLTHQTKIIEQNLRYQLLMTDNALNSIRSQLSDLNASQLSQLLSTISDAAIGLRTLLVLGLDGTVTASNRPNIVGVNSKNRDYFKYPLQGRDPDTLYVSPPFKSVLGVYLITVSKVILDDHGKVAGVIGAALSPEYFNTLLNSVLSTPGMRTSLIHSEGKIIIEEPGRTDLAGKNLARPGTHFTEHLEGGQPVTVFASAAWTTGDLRMSSWRTIQTTLPKLSHPLLTTVNRDMKSIFAEWLRVFYIQVTFLVLLVLSTSLGLYFYQKRQRAYDALVAIQEEERNQAEIALAIAKEDAENANKAKSDFLASMSHDLRTPLNAIMGFSDMMRLQTFGPLGCPQYEGYANDIHSSGELLVSLINDVLDLSKIEAGKYELTEEHLDVSVLIQASFRQLTPMATKLNHTLSSDIHSDMPSLLGDERAMTQILNNLLSNAIKFTPDGGAIDVTAQLEESDSITLTIRDTGMGMSKEGIAKALRPYEQADGMHSKRHEGTGLGLHLCSNLMMLFGGNMDIQSKEGIGTTITLRFPSERTVHLS